MAMLDVEIRRHLARYLSGEITLRAFQDWFTPQTWDIEHSEDRDAEEAAKKVALALAEFSRGHWDEASLRRELLPLVQNYSVEPWPHRGALSLRRPGNVTEARLRYAG